MNVELEISIACRDNQDGSQGVFISNTREECLKFLDRTEEQLKEGNSYEDGVCFSRVLKLQVNEDYEITFSEPLYIDTDG